MANTQNALIFAVLCILASSLTQASVAEHRPPHIHHELPLDPSDAEGRPPHIHGVSPLLPPGIVGRPPHHSSEEAPLDSSDADGRPPHHSSEEAPLDSSDADGRPPHHSSEEAPLDSSDAKDWPPHILDIHEEDSQDKPFQFDIPEWISISPGVNWTPCDIRAGPRARCHDCHTRLFCTRLGGLVIDCPDESSYCRNGQCSDVPVAGCV